MERTKQKSLIEQVLGDYERYGIVPVFSGGDDEADSDQGENKDSDGNRAGDKSGKESGKGDDKGAGGFKPITSQEDLDAIVIKRLKRQEKNLREEITQEIQDALEADARKKAAEEQGDYKKLFEDSQAEVEKLKKKIETMESEVKQKTIDELRKEVIDEFSLPKDLADRLRGETKEELVADAKKLSEIVGPREAPDIDTGKTNGDGNRRKSKDDKDKRRDPSYWGLPS